jgi:hypothetical protein
VPPELYFALTLLVKMAITAGLVLAATVTAERAGPLVGGLVATLPLGAGPVYVFLALDHGASFIAASAVNSLAINTVNVIFALTYALLAQKRPLPVSLSLALLLWFALAWTVHEIHWTMLPVILLNIVVLGVSIALVAPLRHVPIPRVKARWYDLAMRAGLVALLVGLTVTLSFSIGPSGSGILASSVLPSPASCCISPPSRLAGSPARRWRSLRRSPGVCWFMPRAVAVSRFSSISLLPAS